MATNLNMIPKYLHYCWFGGNEPPDIVKKCIDSWLKFCPDFKIIKWDEKNFDININKYVEIAYKNKKYAFVSDYARIWILYHYGGVYVDSDVEIIRRLDNLLYLPAFTGYEGYYRISTGIIGAQKGHEWIKAILDFYDKNIDKLVNVDNGTVNIISNVDIITYLSYKLFDFKVGNQFHILKTGVHVFPMEYFCPIAPDRRESFLTDKTYCIHHFSGTWLGKKQKLKIKIKNLIGLEGSRLFWRLQLIKREKLFKNFFLPST
ncbi:glycosyltransferase sugar-binding region containing DXD motif [Caldicellulosiruptor owensensis OL]|uniref:Glycosyltransferase sugar-binding region containing DXD motif n=1 Tax=Caldicellulosiruptor owensensis (strain ATCC 700167 / DSM 13100 / OL) TaxID=632518 RepID=E4Q5S8_CALOW|nr:sugar-binding protein [Caldicellulosiruptor owensensis]ADQ05487.1 glycosyltransferase sugar-binding region containing DXD motif [Caldicellulosiruptor owensensis OL]